MSPSTRRNGVRSAEIGREAETAVVNVLRASGFGVAERRRVRARDALDIIVCPGVIASVKGGQQARTASLGDIARWTAEADRKRDQEALPVVLLVVQRNGYGRDRAGAWRTWVLGLDRDGWETTLTTATNYLRALGYGDPTPEGDPQ